MLHIDTKHLPIGIFDSGVGGLTVLKAIHEKLPCEDLLYLGDTARLPYGTKSKDTVASYALQAAAKLVERGIKMLVIACNTATAAALPLLRSTFAPLPVLGVIEPGARAAVNATKNGHIAVIATEGTINGKAYHHAMGALCPQVRITAQACTLFVHLAEEGWMQGSIVEEVARRYLAHIFLQPQLQHRPDTLLLGCTHFPPLRHTLSQVLGNDVMLVDSAATTAEAVFQSLTKQNSLRIDNSGQCHFLTTDDAERFARVGSLFLEKKLQKNLVEHMDI